MTDNVIDLKTKKKLERIENPDGETLQQFMRRWSKAIKDGDFKSVMIVVMDENELADWGFHSSIERHYDIWPIIVDRVNQEIKDDILGIEYEIEFLE